MEICCLQSSSKRISVATSKIDISKKNCRDENPYPWNVSTGVLENSEIFDYFTLKTYSVTHGEEMLL